jgi:hypothetical protein
VRGRGGGGDVEEAPVLHPQRFQYDARVATLLVPTLCLVLLFAGHSALAVAAVAALICHALDAVSSAQACCALLSVSPHNLANDADAALRAFSLLHV